MKVSKNTSNYKRSQFGQVCDKICVLRSVTEFIRNHNHVINLSFIIDFHNLDKIDFYCLQSDLNDFIFIFLYAGVTYSCNNQLLIANFNCYVQLNCYVIPFYMKTCIIAFQKYY